MKTLITVLLFLTTYNLFASSIAVTISSAGKAPKGTLFIFAKKYNSSMPMPLAVKKIVNPTFPLKFSLSKKDRMMEGIPFVGPFTVTARISPSGNAMDKSGVEVSTIKKIEIGEKNIQLVLK